MIGRPQSNTIRAASGSCQMLNSAEAVVLPSVIAPPMTRMPAIRSRSSGWVRTSSAMFVSGPDGGDRHGRRAPLEDGAHQLDRALRPGPKAGSGRSAPSSPLAPWTLDATCSGRSSGPRGAGRDRDVRPPDEREHPERVASGLGQAGIARRPS